MESNYDLLRETYPAIISGDQLCRVCHISKRKAKWLLENGVIPCEDTGGKTRRYRIQLEDAIAYLKKGKKLPAPPKGSITCPKPRVRPPLCTEDEARARLTALWREEPDALTVQRTVELSGYSPCTVGRWIKAGKLAAVWYFSRYRISKLSLIEHLAAMSEHEPQYLSARHREMLEGAWDAPRE